ncbi:hypothetical protein B0H17DRAFT_1142417, partial [Mycena rosella]
LQPVNTGKSACKRACYYDPFKDLKMESVRPRPQTQRRCGQDIVRFYWRKKGKPDVFVGGVRAIRCREALEAWRYGSMTAAGNRQASGGGKGDIYGPYACHEGDTPETSKLCFAMQWTPTSWPSPVHGDLDMGEEDLKLGRGLTNSLAGYYPCIQLTKKNCGRNNYSFAYVRWGVVIETRPNTVCYVTAQVLLASFSIVFTGSSMGVMNTGQLCRAKVPTIRILRNLLELILQFVPGTLPEQMICYVFVADIILDPFFLIYYIWAPLRSASSCL